ncbi:UDP-GlcNAc:undecaprenyl-phosphate GlcNAc-1-phosphate transferase [Sulfuritortus calidifontis]|uniref:UDP-GlcNAc:undecaprenyl-phosphate GlcNAc-1-phosphate transferase n=1 Tax=Sulfuritortus calidifontis TaxID=1914471 RepID=A0A4R3JVG6_9PROT|nr:MraY family glycosyltransferase [Sulfuritortus calidifontis]TCS71923.1 UDP-GlcNAc:undecaprenyl-phosphate GlcNAc-1-phosphate transferase [Sulfuritortus calidifontis]
MIPHPPWQLALLAGVVTALFILLLARFAKRLSLLDTPHGHKQHKQQTPVVGGIALALGFFISAGIGGYWPAVSPAFWLASAMLLATGVLDDMREFGSRPKFIIQIAGALMMVYWAGGLLTDLGDLFGFGYVQLGWAAVPFTVFGVIGVINAINMIDGIDGLAGALGLASLLGFAVIAQSAGLAGQAELILLLAATLVVFLGFNLRTPWRSQAAIFLGNAGSLFLGFVLAWYAVTFASPSTGLMQPVTALWLLAIPLFDAVRMTGKRLCRGRNPFAADREHLHHLLMGLGMPVSRVVPLVLVVHCGFIALGLANEFWLHWPAHGMYLGFLLVFAGYVVLLRWIQARLAVDPTTGFPPPGCNRLKNNNIRVKSS